MGKHAIIVIKNHKNEYLQYYDEIWKSYLFLNCKIDNRHDINKVEEKVQNDLDIKSNKIECIFKGKKKHKKFSESDKIEKEYEHYFFDVDLVDRPNTIEKDCFEIDNVKYKWFSYDDLQKDARIQEVNRDIVSYVKEFE